MIKCQVYLINTRVDLVNCVHVFACVWQCLHMYVCVRACVCVCPPMSERGCGRCGRCAFMKNERVLCMVIGIA